MSKRKPYDQMTTAELAAATSRYDRPFAALEESRPLTPAMRRMHARAAKRGRPRIGKGAAKLYVSMERGLLKQCCCPGDGPLSGAHCPHKGGVTNQQPPAEPGV
jgi:hypothetical protein